MKYSSSFAISLLAFLAFALPVRADVPPPETEPCVGKQVGDACTYKDAAGACQNQTCVRISGSYACVACNVTSPTATDTATLTKSDGGEPPAKDDSACSIGKPITAKRVAPWLVAGSFSLLFLLGRRRRR
jgi:hypothetical protein